MVIMLMLIGFLLCYLRFAIREKEKQFPRRFGKWNLNPSSGGKMGCDLDIGTSWNLFSQPVLRNHRNNFLHKIISPRQQ